VNPHLIDFLRLKQLAVTHETVVHEIVVLDPCKRAAELFRSGNKQEEETYLAK
jgi:hypothetical protein